MTTRPVPLVELLEEFEEAAMAWGMARGGGRRAGGAAAAKSWVAEGTEPRSYSGRRCPRPGRPRPPPWGLKRREEQLPLAQVRGTAAQPRVDRGNSAAARHLEGGGRVWRGLERDARRSSRAWRGHELVGASSPAGGSGGRKDRRRRRSGGQSRLLQ
eukprot:SM006263S20082  [mRNA]  locus=s6263:102:641:+ [translate_table: standard]